MKEVIKKKVYDGIVKIVEEINPKSHKEVIQHRDYKKIYSMMSSYEKENQDIIIDCIIDKVSLMDIYETIKLSKEVSISNDETMDLVDEIENSTNEVFMLSDQKVIEAEPVDVTIGDVFYLDDFEEENPVEEIHPTRTPEHKEKKDEKPKNLYALLQNSTDRFKTMCDFFRNVDYGINYREKIKETAMKEYDEFNNGGSKLKLLGSKVTNPAVWNDISYMTAAYRTVHNC